MEKLKKIVVAFIIVMLIAITAYAIYSYISIKNVNKYNTENILKETGITKEEAFKLIDKGLQSDSYVEIYMYSKEFLESNDLVPVFWEGEYREKIDYFDLSKYKQKEFKFITLRNTEECIWGYFEKNDEQKEKTHIIIDKLSGKIKALNNNSIQVVVY